MAMEPELLKHLFKKRATLLYPFEKIEPPEHFRGKHDGTKPNAQVAAFVLKTVQVEQ